MSYFFPQAAVILRVQWEDFGSKDDARLKQVYTLPITPKRVNVNINDYTQADTFSCELDYKSFPFDPRCIRSLGVSIFMDDMKDSNFASGKFNQIKPGRNNIIFQGFADEESIKLDDTSRMVSFDGRDFTALLIDAPFDITKPLSLDRPLNAIIQDLLTSLAATRGEIRVENRTGADLPNLSQFAPDFSPFSTQRSGKKSDKYWDVIQDLVGRAGLIAFIEIDRLVISKPRNVYSAANPYQFVYGKNLKSLQFKRKIGRQKGFNISVRSFVPERKEVIEAKIPEEATQEFCSVIGLPREPVKIQKMDTEGQVKEEVAPYIGFRVPDIASKEQLVKIGERIFEEVGRQQIEGNFETKEMRLVQANKNGDRFEVDVTRIRNGTPVRIEIDQGDMEGIRRLDTIQARAKFLIERGFNPQVADALAASIGKQDIAFYTKAVEFSIDSESGFSMRLDFINFIDLKNKGLK